MTKDQEIKEMVKQKYSEIALQDKEINASSCCGSGSCSSEVYNIMSEEYVKDFKEKIYTEKFKTENLALKKHHEKPTSGDYAPCWKVFEYLTFGSIITIFNNIKDEEVRQRVCDKYNIKHLNKFNLLLNSVRLIRNICAHSGVLFDYSLPKSVSTIPQINFN